MPLEIFSMLEEFFKPSADLQPQVWTIGKDRHVVYSPFLAEARGRKLGTSWEKWGGAEPGAKYIVVRHGDMSRALGFVKDRQVLYIVSHCSPRAKTISDNLSNQLTAEQLAQRIANDGLSKGHGPIKLYACSGGTGGVDSFASQLLAELNWQGYFAVELYAYVSTVCSLDPQTGRKSALDLDENGNPMSGPRVRASAVRIRVTL